MKTILRTVVATALLGASLSTGVSAQEVRTSGQLTLARNLSAMQTINGYQLSGELQSHACVEKTRFVRTGEPNVFAAQRYPNNQKIHCELYAIIWSKARISVITRHLPRYVYVREAGGSTIRVRVQSHRPIE